ncbi:MAG: glutaredoxin family protein [Alphaproteobacteria bacterium]
MKTTTKLLSLLGALFIGNAMAADITIYYSPTCPHCHHAREFTKNNFIYEYPTISVTEIDVTNDANKQAFVDVLVKCKYQSGGVPVITIGDKCYQGFGESMADEMREAISVDLTDEAKNKAKEIKEEIAKDGDAYRSAHATEAAPIKEYTSSENEDEKKNDQSATVKSGDDGTTAYFWGFLAVLVIALGVVMARSNKKKK